MREWTVIFAFWIKPVPSWTILMVPEVYVAQRLKMILNMDRDYAEAATNTHLPDITGRPSIRTSGGPGSRHKHVFFLVFSAHAGRACYRNGSACSWAGIVVALALGLLLFLPASWKGRDRRLLCRSAESFRGGKYEASSGTLCLSR